MSPAVPEQHPAVVLRSHYLHLRSLLVIAVIALLAMAIAVVIIASAGTRAPERAVAVPATRYDGGPDEGTHAPIAPPPPATDRYDGGPDEGTAARAVR
jgi:hypothetical protein